MKKGTVTNGRRLALLDEGVLALDLSRKGGALPMVTWNELFLFILVPAAIDPLFFAICKKLATPSSKTSSYFLTHED